MGDNYFFYFFSAMRRARQPNDKDVQWRWSCHEVTWRGKL